MISNINKDNVILVSEKIMIPLTQEQINKILHMYTHEEECDPNCSWEILVERCIYQIINNK